MKNNPFKILLIEDNPGDARLVQEALSEAGSSQFEMVVSKDLTKGLTHLASHSVDVILLDITLPDSTGFDTFQTVNEKA